MLTTALLTGTGVVTGLLTGPALRLLPEPVAGAGAPDSADAADAADAAAKIPYRQLASPRFAVGIAACSMAALLVVAARADPSLWPAWIPLATIGTFLVGIDAVTTWLPLRLTQALWGSAALGLAVTVAISTPAERAGLAFRILLGGAVVTVFFWSFWWLTGGLGFGDVRLAPVLGATASSVSFNAAVVGLIAGTLLGALHGLVRRLRNRSGPFPYGPALVVGVFAGLVSVA